MIAHALTLLVEGSSLTREQAGSVMEEILTGQATPALFGAFVTALRIKGETVDEITGMAETMRRHATQVPLNGMDVVDTCGTGGAGANRWFNVSTTAAFVAAGAGAKVAKHGNRGMTRASGSADVLEALGVSIAMPPEVVAEAIATTGVGFMFAQLYHPAMKFAAPLRRELGIRTAFNFLGPLTNPAGAKRHLLGVADPAMTSRLASALGAMGTTRAIVVHGHSGVDEISLTGPTDVIDVQLGHESRYQLTPEGLGLNAAPADAFRGGTPKENAVITRAILTGEDRGPRRDLVLANAAGALLAAGIAADWTNGVNRSATSIDNGAAIASLDALVALSSRTGGT